MNSSFITGAADKCRVQTEINAVSIKNENLYVHYMCVHVHVHVLVPAELDCNLPIKKTHAMEISISYQ